MSVRKIIKCSIHWAAETQKDEQIPVSLPGSRKGRFPSNTRFKPWPVSLVIKKLIKSKAVEIF